MKLNLDCVWSLNRREFTKFLKNSESYDSVIDFYSIVVKLSKSDPNGIEPPDTVVGLHLVKNIKAAKEANHENVLYVIKNLTADTVDVIEETFCSIFETNDIDMNLIIVNREDYPRKGVLSKFKTVKFIDKL